MRSSSSNNLLQEEETILKETNSVKENNYDNGEARTDSLDDLILPDEEETDLGGTFRKGTPRGTPRLGGVDQLEEDVGNDADSVGHGSVASSSKQDKEAEADEELALLENNNNEDVVSSSNDFKLDAKKKQKSKLKNEFKNSESFKNADLQISTISADVDNSTLVEIIKQKSTEKEPNSSNIENDNNIDKKNVVTVGVENEDNENDDKQTSFNHAKNSMGLKNAILFLDFSRGILVTKF